MITAKLPTVICCPPWADSDFMILKELKIKIIGLCFLSLFSCQIASFSSIHCHPEGVCNQTTVGIPRDCHATPITASLAMTSKLSRKEKTEGSNLSNYLGLDNSIRCHCLFLKIPNFYGLFEGFKGYFFLPYNINSFPKPCQGVLALIIHNL